MITQEFREQPLVQCGDDVKLIKSHSNFVSTPIVENLGNKLSRECIFGDELIALLGKLDEVADKMHALSYKRGITQQLAWSLRTYAYLLNDMGTHIWSEID